MTLRHQPKIQAFERPAGAKAEFDHLVPGIRAKWDAGIRAAMGGDGLVIDIYEPIGEDPWSGGGVTAKAVKDALKPGASSITVNMNSPGGDYFDGLAIYNLLRDYPAPVNINIMGLAASAASVIAMAGDTVKIAKAGFLMVHKCWGLVMGNTLDFQHAAEIFAKFDAGAVIAYAARSENTDKQCAEWMDASNGAGTWFTGDEAVAAGFCDELVPADAVTEDKAAQARQKPANALREADLALAMRRIPRAERRAILNEIKSGKPGAAVTTAMQDAGITALADDLRALSSTLSQR